MQPQDDNLDDLPDMWVQSPETLQLWSKTAMQIMPNFRQDLMCQRPSTSFLERQESMPLDLKKVRVNIARHNPATLAAHQTVVLRLA